MKLDTIDLDELEDLIAQSEERTALAVRKVMKRVAYDATLKMAGSGHVSMVAADQSDSPAGPLEPPPFGVLQNVYAYWAEMLSELFAPLLQKAWSGGVNSAIKSLHNITPEWEAPEADPLAVAALEKSRVQIGNLATELWQHAQQEIIMGVEAGDSVQQMASRVAKSADLSIPHAQTIVRTEVIAAANQGTFDLIEMAGFTGTQEWLATNDPKTRKTHRIADGQTVDIGDYFVVGGYSAKFPGAPSLPPGERFNCRCTVAYDVTDDDMVAALVAAGKWDAKKHPRDSKGKFVKKGLLGILNHSATESELGDELNALTVAEWQDLTPAQKKTIAAEVGMSSSKDAQAALADLQAFDKADADTAEASDSLTKSDWDKMSNFEKMQALNDAYEADDSKKKNLIQGFIDADKPKNVGAAIKITHKDIHSPKKSGEILAVSKDGKTTIVWNETQKKYTVIAPGSNITMLGKSKVYDFMQGHDWHAPVKQPDHINAPNFDDVDPIEDTEPPPLKLDMPKIGTKAAVKKAAAAKKVGKKVAKKIAPLTSPKPVSQGSVGVPADVKSFVNYKKVGSQGGSNPGGTFQNLVSKEEWYVKKAKTKKHASNDIAASALYRAAGLDVPQVHHAIDAPGIGGGFQSASKMVPGATKDLSSKLSDADYKKQIQRGFAVDAWLANWDVAGLSMDNIVTGADGKPYRIDTGGSLLYRAQGKPKGVAFGPTVTELDTLRDPITNFQSAKIFGDMTESDIRESAKLVQAVSPEQIDQIVKEAGLPSSVAETLKQRRNYILSKYGLDKDSSSAAPVATPLPTTSTPTPLTPTSSLKPADEEPDWSAIGEEIKKDVYEPNTTIAEDQFGHSIVVDSNGYDVALLDDMGEYIDSASAEDIESLIIQYGSGWKLSNVLEHDDDSFTIDATPNDPGSLDAPETPWPPTHINGTDVPENVGGSPIQAYFVHPDMNDFIAVQNTKGELFWIQNGKVNAINSGADVKWLRQVGYEMHTALSDKPDTTSPTTSNMPNTVDGVNVPSEIGGSPVHTVMTSPNEDQGVIVVVNGQGQTYFVDDDASDVAASSLSQEYLTKNGWKTVWTKSEDDVAPTTTAPTPSPTPAAPAAPAALTPVTMMGYDKIKAKNAVKAAGLGYWSKPEKIWDVVKQIQAANPHPDNSAHSKFTPLQILQGLDEQLKTAKPNPYVEKITKWLNTPAGKQHAGELGGVPSVTPTTSPVKITGKKITGKKITAAKKVGGLEVDVADAIGVPAGDISMIPNQNKIFTDFKALGSTYLSSPDAHVFGQMKLIANEHKLSVLQVAQIVDLEGAKKAGVPNANLFEKKLIKWAKTPHGSSTITGKPLPTATGPVLKFGNPVLPKAETDKYTYNVVPHSGSNYTPSSKALQLQADAEAKYGKMTSAEKASLKYFTGGAYTTINRYLRGESTMVTPTVLNHIKNIQAGMRPSTEPMLLHRGVGWSALGVTNITDAKKLIGKKGVHKGFSSTSVGGSAAFGGAVLLEIEAPPGTPMAYVHPFSSNKPEREMLLAAGLEFEILDIKPNPNSSGGVVARVRIIPS